METGDKFSVIKRLVENEDGDLIIQLEPEELEKLGWNDGDEIDWTDNEDGSWNLKKTGE